MSKPPWDPYGETERDPSPGASPEAIVARLRKIQGQLEGLRSSLQEPHNHRWDILGVWVPPSRNIHPRDMTGAHTVVLLRCKECDWPETTDLDGTWTKAQVLRKASSDDSEEMDNAGGE